MQKLDNLYVSELEFEDSGMRGPKGESGDAPSLSICNTAPYLYRADLRNYSYQDGEMFVRRHYPDNAAGACASIRKNQLFGHNYDAPYDNTAEFVIRTPARHGTHSAMGIAAIPGILTQDMVDAETESDLTKEAYNVLPLFMLDGVNECGVAVSLHRMPGEDASYVSDDSGMCALFAVRYVLDNAESAEHAANLVTQQAFWFPHNASVSGGYYLMIADAEYTYKADLSGHAEMVAIGEPPILTNFRTIEWDGEYDSLEEHANGIERYNLLSGVHADIYSAPEMFDALKNIRYTGVYDDTKAEPWYSDYNGDWSDLGLGSLTIHTAASDYAPVMTYMKNRFSNRRRDGRTKQTVHTAVYDLENLTLSVMVQEDDHVYRFCMTEEGLIMNEIDRAKAAEQAEMERAMSAEQAIRDDFANMFYYKPEVDDALSALKDETLGDVAEYYYDRTATQSMLAGMHDTISAETDTKLAGKANAYENDGTTGQVLYRTSTGAGWGSLPTQLPNVTQSDNNKVLTVEDGVWVASDKFADYFRYVNITVSITSDNGGVPSGGITVFVKNADTEDVINQAEYTGQPVTFRIPHGLRYRVEQVGTWEGYTNPTPAYVEVAATNDATIVFTYEAIRVPETLRELQIIVDSGSAASMRQYTGLQFDDTYTENGTEYQIIWDLKDVLDVEDQNGNTHTGVVLEWHYATPTLMPFDAAERQAVDLNEEPTAQDGVYYYGLSSGTYRLLSLNTGDPLPTTYEAIYKNAIRNTDANIIRRGYSNYAESAIRKWLNSGADRGEWWHATHVGDMPPEQADTLPGFMNGCSEQILAMAKPVVVKYVTAGGTYETVSDTFFIPSVSEVYGLSNAVSEGEPWRDWIEATGLSEPGNDENTGRRIYGVASHPAPYIGLRTANTGYQYIVWDIHPNGMIDGYGNASTARAYTPCCVVYK